MAYAGSFLIPLRINYNSRESTAIREHVEMWLEEQNIRGYVHSYSENTDMFWAVVILTNEVDLVKAKLALG
jgi:hypothetical protein